MEKGLNPKDLEKLLSNNFNENNMGQFVYQITKNLIETDENLYEVKDENYEVIPIKNYKDKNGLNFQVILVKTENPSKIEKARIEQREIIRKYIKQNMYSAPSGILAVFYSPDYPLWRLSFVEIDWDWKKGEQFKTPPKRYSYLVGEGEPVYTPVKQLSKLLENPPETITEIKEAFSVEPLTEEFFQKYRELYLKLKEYIENEPTNLKLVENLKQNGYNLEDFVKKLLGQLVFLYFLQKKGWLGVPEDKPYGEGDRKFLRNLFERAKQNSENYYLKYLIPLFYDTLNNSDRNKIIPDLSDYFGCRIPFLNGGLFEPIYDYKNILVYIDNKIFSNENEDGILDVFDTYNFTAKEDEPLEKEVAVDPEMLGKVFENLISENERKGQGAFYTPREIVHYMSQQSIIYYLSDNLNLKEEDVKQIFIAEHFEDLPNSIKEKSKEIDDALKNLKVVDPACGSGAFLVGVLHEILKARNLLNKDINVYQLKKEAIENSIYGVDIDVGATEIAKLRLWLSLIVDEENPNKIEPLPNLDYKIMCGNSLLEELVIGDEVIQLSVENDYKKDLSSQIDILKGEINKKRTIYFKILKAKGKNDKEAKNLENEIKSLEKKIKNLEGKPQQMKNASLSIVYDPKSAFEEIKSLQHQFFNEHIPEKKRQLKQRIDEKLKEFVLKRIQDEEDKLWNKINQINNKYITTKIPLSEENKIKNYVEILDNLNKYKQNLDFKGCNKNFFLWHLNFSEVFREKGGFDIVIANPPYGVRVDTFNEKRYKYYDRQKNSASFFIELATHLSNEKGIMTYIVPKSLTFSEGWHATRELILEKNTLKTIIDVSKAFERVKLEQVIIIYKKSKNDSDYEFLTGNNWSSEIKIKGYSTKSLSQNLNTIPIYIDEEKLKILSKLLKDSIMLDSISETSRGLPLQRKISKNGNLPILRGRDIKKYTIYGEMYKISLTKEELRKNKVKKLLKPKIVSQNIVAHVMNPYDRIIIVATLDKEGVLTLDTVMNTFITNQNYSYQYILALLNSKLAEWYFYWFIFNRAIRTMHFDKYYMGKLPVKKLALDQQKPFIELVDNILQLTSREDYEHRPKLQEKVKEYSDQIDQLVYTLYNLTDEEIKRIER